MHGWGYADELRVPTRNRFIVIAGMTRLGVYLFNGGLNLFDDRLHRVRVLNRLSVLSGLEFLPLRGRLVQISAGGSPSQLATGRDSASPQEQLAIAKTLNVSALALGAMRVRAIAPQASPPTVVAWLVGSSFFLRFGERHSVGLVRLSTGGNLGLVAGVP